VHFPGAVNSKFTTTLAFQTPSTNAAIPTYRIMDSDGLIVDEGRAPKDVGDEEAVRLYKDMLLSEFGGLYSWTLDARGMFLT
jgi:2-oxoisovalerate dehydrogenase E1 component alpha subunit